MSKLRLVIVLAAFVVLALGVYQVSTDSALASNCPGSTGCGCSLAYAPVVCKGNCKYTNMCIARCAGFTSSQCKSIGN